MASTLNPYLSFLDNAREAIGFYASVLGGEPTISTFGEFGAPDESIANLVMHAHLATPAGFTLMASDTPPGVEHSAGSAITVSLSGDDEAELRGYWDKLSEGATITIPLEKQMWGDTFGQLTDRFGVGWLVDITTGSEAGSGEAAPDEAASDEAASDEAGS